MVPVSSRAGYADGSTPHRSRRVLDWTSLREVPQPSKETRQIPNPAPVILTSSRRCDIRKPLTGALSPQEGSPPSPSSPTSCRAKDKADALQKVLQHTVEDVARRFFSRSEKLLAPEVAEDDVPLTLPGGVPRSSRTGSETSGLGSSVGDSSCQATLPIPGRAMPDISSSINTDRLSDSLQSSAISEALPSTPTEDLRSRGFVDSPTSTQGLSPARRQVHVARGRKARPHEEDSTQQQQQQQLVRRWGRCASRSPSRAPRGEEMEPKPTSRSKSLGRPRTTSIRSPSGALDSPSSSHHKSVSFASSSRKSVPDSPTQGHHSPSKRPGAAKSLQIPKSPTAESGMRGQRSGSFSRLPGETPDAGRKHPSTKRSLLASSESNPEPSSPEGSSRSYTFSRRLRSPSSDRRGRDGRNFSPTLQERTSTAIHALEHGMEPPGASDKWRVAQLFCELVPRSVAKIQRIERVVTPETYGKFMQKTGTGENANEFGIVFFTPKDADELNRVCSHGLAGRSPAARVVSDCGAALENQLRSGEPGKVLDVRSMCVLFCGPEVARSKLGGASDRPKDVVEFEVEDASHFLPAYTIHYQIVADEPSDHAEFRFQSPSPEHARSPSRSRRVSVRDPLVQGILQRLPELGDDVAGTVLLPSNSPEAEAVISLYLQSGGASRLRRPPGVNLREALGGVVVQRIENKMLGLEYLDVELEAANGPRFREDVVWHGTRLKRADEEASLAHKLQSIAEHGFDPQRCIKGAHAAGGIWLAANPMESFGVGGDGLVAFVLCLAKTNFNEWVDTSCARVLQRERVLPLYSLVHV